MAMDIRPDVGFEEMADPWEGRKGPRPNVAHSKGDHANPSALLADVIRKRIDLKFLGEVSTKNVCINRMVSKQQVVPLLRHDGVPLGPIALAKVLLKLDHALRHTRLGSSDTMQRMRTDTFEVLVRKHKDAVYRQMVRVCRHREDAEDALAGALMHAFQAADQLTSEDAFRSWLGTIGRRVCTRMRTHPAMTKVVQIAEDKGLVDDRGPEFELAVIKGCVESAVDSLPPIYRDVYLLCEVEEQTVPEAAEALGISVAAAKSRLLRARALVRSNLDRSVCAP